MTHAEIGEIKRRIATIFNSYEQSLHSLEKDEARRSRQPLEDLIGKGRKLALEAHCRAFVIHPLLCELGWTLNSAQWNLPEDPAIAPGESKRYLDFHGRDQDEKLSLIVLEAKRPSVPLPSEEANKVSALISDAIKKINGYDYPENSHSKLSTSWHEFISSLITYVTRVKRDYANAPKRAVICNGDWYVIFKDVESTLLSKNPNENEIIVFEGPAKIEEGCDVFFDLLSYRSLSGYIPPQHPAALPRFVKDGVEPSAVRIVEISHAHHGDRQPVMSARASVWIKSDLGTWIEFHGALKFELIPYEAKAAKSAFQKVIKSSDLLVSKLEIHRKLSFLSASDYERSESRSHLRRPGWQVSQTPLAHLTRNASSGQEAYSLVLGKNAFIVNPDEKYRKCSFHFHGRCGGDVASPSAITSPTSEPRAYFPSGNIYHCATKTMHELRANICILASAGLEQFFCCRNCSFFTRCWPKGDAGLPCNTGA